jgi:hypothetical protein
MDIEAFHGIDPRKSPFTLKLRFHSPRPNCVSSSEIRPQDTCERPTLRKSPGTATDALQLPVPPRSMK